MATYKQLVSPNMGVRDGLGWCLRFTQSVFAAPVAYPSARSAWDGQKGKHVGDLPPRGVAVPIWFDHWGTYGRPAKFGNWGHVAVSLPDGRVLTSPMYASQLSHWDSGKQEMVGSAIYPSIEALQKVIGGSPTYLGWSEFMNDRQIVSISSKVPSNPGQEEDEDMALHQIHCTENGKTLRALHVPGTGYFVPWTEAGATYANRFAREWETGSSVEVTRSLFHALRRAAEAMLPADRVQVSIVDAGDDK